MNKIIIALVLLLALTFSGAASVHASDDIDNKIKELEAKVSELRAQGDSLSSKIGALDGQIKLTEYKIASTKHEISDLESDITAASKRTKNLDRSLTDASKVLINRIRATYKAGIQGTITALLASGDITSFLWRVNYLRVVQVHDKQLVYDTQQAKEDYVHQKEISENKKTKVLGLKTQLEEYTTQLDQDRKDKENLLTVTRNSEKDYQARLASARAEQQAILQATGGGGSAIDIGPVQEGDVIGHMIIGESACSTGTHVHFEVYKDGSLQNPADYLANKSVTWNNSPDGQFSFSGSWRFPVSDEVSIYQGYGMTSFARSGFYGGGPHTGIDMGSSSTSVHAVKPGQLYRGSVTCKGRQLLFARVDQQDGFRTFYFHITP